MNTFWDWNYVISFMPKLLEGLVVTIEVTFVAFIIAAVVGLMMALGRRSAPKTQKTSKASKA